MPQRVRNQFRRAICSMRRASFRGSEDGATLVEFSLIFPIFMILFMGIIEFSLAFNANLGINRASQDAALVASEAATDLGSDCLILQVIEDEVGPPNNKAKIQEVRIEQTTASGNTVLAANTYNRGGTLNCTTSDGTDKSVPYTATATGYPIDSRCNLVIGCVGMPGSHSTVDTIGVQIKYSYTYQTPLGSLSNVLWNDPSAKTWTFTKRNVFRIEPIR